LRNKDLPQGCFVIDTTERSSRAGYFSSTVKLVLAAFRRVEVTDEPVKDESYWRKRADEARRAARSLTHPTAKRELLFIAENYERLAKQVQVAGRKRTASDPSHRRRRKNG